jgi:hypothetical protein
VTVSWALPQHDLPTDGSGLSQSIGTLRHQAAHSDGHLDGKFLALSPEVQHWRQLILLVND